jgi:hypothetical protein
MVVVKDRLKSYSVLTEKEYDETTRQLIEALEPDELQVFIELLEDQEKLIDFQAMEYEEIPVPIEQWLEDEYFLGRSSKGIYKAWKDDLIELFSSGQYHIAIITGSLGSGKSEFASLAILRMLYEASCLRDPAVSYGLSAGSKMGFCNLAPSETVAKNAFFEKALMKIKDSPYFQEKFRPLTHFKDKDKLPKGNVIEFPKGLFVICGSSTDTASLGANIMGGFVDELNFFKKDAAGSNHGNAIYGSSSRAGRLFQGLMRRMKSRFMRKGKLPGILIGASSKTTEDSLCERIIRDAERRGDKTVFVRDRNIVDVKPEAFSNESFRVLIGTENYRSRILEDDEEVLLDDATVIDVPEDLRSSFDMNIEEALRDLMGVATYAISSFINKVEKVKEAVDESREHPFECPLMPDPAQWDSRLPYKIDWASLCERNQYDDWTPRINPQVKRYVHLDLGLTHDAFGVCIGHISGLQKVTRANQSGEVIEYQPRIIIDFILRIKGEPGEEVIIRNVRQLLYQFTEHGFHLANISMDTCQTREMMQQLDAAGYKTDTISVDDKKDPYLMLRNAIYENRVEYYSYPVLLDELRHLEENVRKVDHPVGGHKDLADALAGVVYALSRDATYAEPVLPEMGVSSHNKQPNFEEEFVAQEMQEIEANDKYRKRSRPKVSRPAYNKVDSSGKKRDDYRGYITDVIEIG